MRWLKIVVIGVIFSKKIIADAIIEFLSSTHLVENSASQRIAYFLSNKNNSLKINNLEVHCQLFLSFI